MTTSCVLLSGGVGGAKLALGMSHCLAPDELTVIANVGDDFDHLGLRICPDLDTLMYTLAGIVNPDSGWGQRDESWHCLETLARLGGPDWFRLGDRDLAVHLLRTQALAGGTGLAQVTARLCERLGVTQRLLPVTEDALATRLRTNRGLLAFQEYFVAQRAQPVVSRIEYAGAEIAQPAPGVAATLLAQDLRAIVLAPSNPYLSIDPILAVPGVGRALRDAPAPVIAVSPIVGGRALKGPTAKIMRELGLEATAGEVAQHYRDWLDGFILDRRDVALAAGIEATGTPVCVCDTVMNDLSDKTRLAEQCLAFADTLGTSSP